MLQALLFSGIYECLLVGALFLVVHMVLGNMVEPRMMGHRLGMSTLVVFLSLLVWGWLLGPVGMLLSVPLTSVCKIWMETTVGGSKLAILLGQAVPKAGSQKLAAFHRPEDSQYAGDDDRHAQQRLPVERLMPARQPDGGGPHEDIAQAQ